MIYLPYALSLVVQVFLLSRLIPGAVRRFPVLVLYSLALFLSNIGIGVVAFSSGVATHLYRDVYWITDLTLDLLRFVLVITLTLKALDGRNVRPGIQRLFGLIIFASVVLPLVLFHPWWTSRWFRHTSQLMSLGGAIMNLLLWTVLLGRRKRDPQLLFVCAGLGLSVTGVAITYGLLQFSAAHIRWLPDLIKSTTLLAGMLIWCYAFRPSKKTRVETCDERRLDTDNLLERVA